MLRACSPCEADAAAFGGAPAFPGAPAYAVAGAPTSPDDACSGDASSSAQNQNKTDYSHRSKIQLFSDKSTTFPIKSLTLILCREQIRARAMRST